MEVSGPTGAYAQAILQKSIQTQGKVLMNLMNVSKQVETTHAKPLMNIKNGAIDLMA